VDKYYKLPRLGKSAQELGENEISRLKTIESLIPKGVKIILDIGCGDGIICNPLSRKFRIIGIDFSKEALVHVGTEKLLASAEYLPFKKGTFDLVILSDILEHLSEDALKNVIEQAEAISSKYILINVPNKENLSLNSVRCPKCSKIFHPNWHIRAFDKRKILKLFSRHRLVSMEYCGLSKLRFSGFLTGLKRFFTGWAKPNSPTVCPFCDYIVHEGNMGEGKVLNKFTENSFKLLSRILGRQPSEIVMLLEGQL
jgi:SAM-dependent methyltransferase